MNVMIRWERCSAPLANEGFDIYTEERVIIEGLNEDAQACRRPRQLCS